MRADGNKIQVHYLLLQYEIVKNEIKKNIEQKVKAPCCCVAKCFGRDEFTERRVKPLDGAQDYVP